MTILSSSEKKLWFAIKDILWEKWDPIGVYESNAEWDDEYDSYVPHLFKLAVNGSDYIRIADSLVTATEQSMGLNTSINHTHELEIAKLIIRTRDEILGK